MRIVFLLPLTAVAVIAGCGSQGKESGALSAPQRDLTLAAQAPQVEIASPIELRQLQIQPRAVRRLPRMVHAVSARRFTEPKVIFASVVKPAPVLAAPTPVAQPAGASEPANDRELLPGKTVTVIPASSGPSAGADGTDEVPAIKGRPMVRGSGGTCRGRGRGPGGIAGVPRPDFR
jgi:hypothetical protein